jgi:hypothetical protein
MAWITITDNDAMAAASSERMSIIAVKGTDDLGDIVAEAIETFRDAIRSSGQPLGPAGTIPLSLKRYVLDWAVWAFVSRGVAKNPAIQDDARKDANDRAEKILFKILNQELKVSADDPAATITLGAAVVRPGRRVRTGSFDKLGES